MRHALVNLRRDRGGVDLRHGRSGSLSRGWPCGPDPSGVQRSHPIRRLWFTSDRRDSHSASSVSAVARNLLQTVRSHRNIRRITDVQELPRRSSGRSLRDNSSSASAACADGMPYSTVECVTQADVNENPARSSENRACGDYTATMYCAQILVGGGMRGGGGGGGYSP